MTDRGALRSAPGRNAGGSSRGAEAGRLRTGRRLDGILAWFIPIVLVGSPIAGVAAVFVPFIESTTINYGYRALVAGTSALMVIGALLLNRKPLFPIAFTVFLLGYLIRLYIDAYMAGIYRADIAILFYFGAVLPPVLAVLFAGRGLSEKRLIRPMLLFTLGSTTALFLLGFFGVESEMISSLEQTGGRLNLETVNAIVIGHVAASLLIASVAAWPNRSVPRPLLVAAATIAVATMLQAGSRGPFVALGVCLIAYSVIVRRWGLLAIALIGVVAVALRSSPDQLVVLERFTTAGWDASASARLLTQDYAIADFLDNPLFGVSYIEQATLDYPHNLFIDTAMAMGLAGLVPLIIVTFQLGRAVVRRFRSGEFLIALLATQYFVAAQFSGSTWAHVQLFTLLALVLVNKAQPTTNPSPSPRP